MNLLFLRIKVLFFVTAIISCVSCTAGQIKNLSRDKYICLNTEQLIDPLRSFLDNEMASLLSLSSAYLPHDVTPELFDNLTALISCSTRLTELDLKDKTAIDRELCNPFPISVTLSGLKESLNEVVECRTYSCTPDKVSFKKKVIQQQTDRLQKLVNTCSKI